MSCHVCNPTGNSLKNVEETTIKLIGDGFLKEHNASVETDKTIGNV